MRDNKHMTFKAIGDELGGKSIERTRQIYLKAKRIQKNINNIEEGIDVSFSNKAAKYLGTRVYNALAKAHKLDSQEIFMEMTDKELSLIRNVGIAGFTEVMDFKELLKNNKV